MSHYDFDRMGWQQFEHLVQALAVKELGNGVRGFGQGKDGRREATFRGKVDFPRGGGELWNGYGVIQVKHRERTKNTTADWTWFLDQVKGELESWARSIATPGLVDLKKRPQYFIFATNVALTGTENSGGIDRFDELLGSYKDRLGLKGWFAWDYTQLRILVDGHPSIRQTFLEQICVGDFLHDLERLLPGSAGVTGRELAVVAASDLTTRQWVRIGDSGFGDNAKLRLAEIGIDLPCDPLIRVGGSHIPGKTRVGAYATLLGDKILRPSEQSGNVNGVVIVGGPGQGKSTVAQLLAHNYRVAFIEDARAEFLGLRSQEALTAMRARLHDQDFPKPTRRRYPLFVELSSYAAFVASSREPDSLLRYLADSILVAGHPLDPRELLRWLAAWPCVLILDGLDEVPNAGVRNRLIGAISSFITETSSVDADLFVIATTRPQGYRQEFDEALHAKSVLLTEFTESEALAYADSIIAIRGSDDPILIDQVTERLVYAVGERLTQRLMTTPLQVTIMTALAERAVELPTTRYELFDAYYRTIYDREVAKHDVKQLAKLRKHVDYLHEQAGLQLQIRGEKPSTPDPFLSASEVSRMLRRRLKGAGFDESESVQKTKQLLSLSSDRLVLLVSPHGREFGFEVRSIQEYMAARALCEGADEVVLARLRALLPSTHWRNTWLLAAGQIMETREHLSRAVVDIVVEYDRLDAERRICLSGASLAADLYLDDIASEFPALRLPILLSALTLLGDTASSPDPAVTSVILSSISVGGIYAGGALDGLALYGARVRSSVAAQLLDQYQKVDDPIGDQARKVLTRGYKYEAPESRDDKSRAYVLGTYFAEADPQPSSPEDTGQIENFREYLLEGPPLQPGGPQLPSPPEWSSTAEPIYAMLDLPAVRRALVSTIDRIREREPDVAHYGSVMLRYRESRLPRSELLP